MVLILVTMSTVGTTGIEKYTFYTKKVAFFSCPRSETRICASLGLRMKFKTLFMSDEEKHGIILICQISFF